MTAVDISVDLRIRNLLLKVDSEKQVPECRYGNFSNRKNWDSLEPGGFELLECNGDSLYAKRQCLTIQMASSRWQAHPSAAPIHPAEFVIQHRSRCLDSRRIRSLLSLHRGP